MDPKTTICFTCDIVDQYIGLANDFTQSLSKVLLFPMWVIFLSLIGPWIVIQGLRMMAVQVTVADFVKELIFIFIATIMLAGQGPKMIDTIYVGSLEMMGSAASIALQVGKNKSADTANISTTKIGGGMHMLVQTAEEGVRKVFSMAEAIGKTGKAYDPMPWLYAIVLIVPYFLVLIVYFSQVVISIFRIMMLAALSPFLMLAFAFTWGRGMAVAAIRTLLSSFMILFGATAALSVMLYAISGLDIGNSAGYTPQLPFITDPKYLLALAMGWMGMAFMTEATGIANSISGSVLSNTGVAIITSGLSASALALLGGSKAMAVKGGGWAAPKVWDGAGKGMGAASDYAQRVADLVRKAKKE